MVEACSFFRSDLAGKWIDRARAWIGPTSVTTTSKLSRLQIRQHLLTIILVRMLGPDSQNGCLYIDRGLP